MAAFAGMYKLWWQRERVEYFGKDVAQQRKVVFQHAGMPQSYLQITDTVNEQWPVQTHYSVQGQLVQGSYLYYLLIPHVPTGDGPYSLVLTEKVIVNGSSPASGQDVGPPGTEYFPAQGFVFSLLSIFGLVLILRRFAWNYSLSVPELFAVACLFVNGVVIGSKVLFQESTPGFSLLLVLGVIGWLSLILQRGSWAIKRTGVEKQKFWQIIREEPRQKLAVWICCSLIALSVLWAILMSVIVVPDDWDAWAIWGAKAKMLALSYGPLMDVTPFGHSDYPLLWPSVWAFSGWCAGGWEELWSRGWGAVFLLFCCWEIVVIVQRSIKRWDIALLAGAMFASVPLVPLIASWSYAEAPFWLMMVSCFGCLSLWRDSGKNGHLLWAALLAVSAAYTKNEGVLFFVITAVWVCTVQGRRLQSFFLFVGVFVLLYAPWYYWVRIVADFSSHATAGLNFSLATVLRAWHRFPKAIEMIIQLYSDIRQWNLVLCGLVLGWLLSLWNTRNILDKLIPVALLSGYLLVVVFHQAEIYWQVGTSWNRLTVQAIPLLIVVVVPSIWKALHEK